LKDWIWQEKCKFPGLQKLGIETWLARVGRGCHALAMRATYSSVVALPDTIMLE